MFRSEKFGRIIGSRETSTIFWEVPNFFADQSPSRDNPVHRYVISSPYFYLFENEWCLSLIQNKDIHGWDIIGFFLWKTPTKSCPSLIVRLTLENFDGRLHKSSEGEIDIYGNFGYWDFIGLETLLESKHIISPSGILRFSCSFLKKTEFIHSFSDLTLENDENSVMEEKIEKETPESEGNGDEDQEISGDDRVTDIPESKGVDRLVQDLKNLLLNGQGSDVTLKVEDREFKAHRNILVVRSPVLASMFHYDTKEKNTGVVDIPDCSAAAFQAFLSYVYTGSADTMTSDNVFELYYVADKYQLNDLRTECREFIEGNLSTENFCDVMTLSLQHNELDLLKKTTDFFCENVRVIVKTVQWQKYVKDYPVEANELYIKAINA